MLAGQFSDPETEQPVPRRGAKGDLCHTIRQTDPLTPIAVQELGVARTTPVLTRKVQATAPAPAQS